MATLISVAFVSTVVVMWATARTAQGRDVWTPEDCRSIVPAVALLAWVLFPFSLATLAFA